MNLCFLSLSNNSFEVLIKPFMCMCIYVMSSRSEGFLDIRRSCSCIYEMNRTVYTYVHMTACHFVARGFRGI